MSKRHTDIDPFNAGEPILPWCDPETFDDNPQAVFDDTDAEREYPDNPPSSGGRSSRSSSKRSQSASRKQPKAPAAKRARTRRPVPGASDQPVSTRKSARPIFIAILVLFLISGGLSLVASIPGCMAGAFSSLLGSFDDTPASLPEGFEDLPESPSHSMEDLSEAESACFDAAKLRMEQLTTPGSNEYQRAVDLITKDFDQACEDYLYYSAEELGVDGGTVASWLIGSLRYEMSSAHAFPNDPSPYGSAYLNVTLADPFSLHDAFFTPASDYLMENGLLGYDDEPGPDDAVRQHLKDLLQNAINSSTDIAEPFVRFELTLTDGVWSISESDYATELEFLFGM